MNILYPFSAILGQHDLKLSLILNLINPGIGGVLIRGEKGTAKSTIVRSVADLVSGIKIVTLPLNATEDRVAGGMDFNRAVKQGKKVFQPGLLSSADKGILYVDEVNLLDDHIVDIILDAAGSGENRVEREGLSFHHKARFILVGTMNPEEGDLRPQLMDRFGLCVEVASEKDIETRIQLMEYRELFDLDPGSFRKAHEPGIVTLGRKIAEAKKIISHVGIKPSLRSFIAELCTTNNVAGHRADIVIEQAAKAHAAYMGSLDVKVEDISLVAKFALLHRKQDADPAPPPPPPPSLEDNPDKDNNGDTENQNQDNKENAGNGENQNQNLNQDSSSMESNIPDSGKKDSNDTNDNKADQAAPEHVFEIGATFKVKKITFQKDKKIRRGSGRRSRSRVSSKQGRYVNSTMHRTNNDIAFDATLRAAAPYQKIRRKAKELFICLKPEDIREKNREKRIGNFLVFLVDASGSMGARGRMAASKGAVLSLLLDAYQKRDKVAMISFRKDRAYINLPPTSSIELAALYLEKMPVGGRTPLSAGLDKAYAMVESALRKDSFARPIIIIITDGKSNVALGNEKPVQEAMAYAEKMGQDKRIKFIVVDTEPDSVVQFGLAGKLSRACKGEYCKIDDLKTDSLVSLVRDNAQ